MAEYKFNDQQVEAILTNFETQVRKFDAELAKFEHAKLSLRSLWEGDEADVYTSIFSKFQSGATSVRNIVAEVHNSLADAGDSNTQMRTHMRMALDT